MMGSDTGDRYRYTGANAEAYGSFGIEGTTYQIGFDAVAELLGDISGKVFLDFGCGAGRSARFLKGLGARQVHAVDHDQNMIDQALAQELDTYWTERDYVGAVERAGLTVTTIAYPSRAMRRPGPPTRRPFRRSSSSRPGRPLDHVS
jgi:SAM-dependent methyltransferase